MSVLPVTEPQAVTDAGVGPAAGHAELAVNHPRLPLMLRSLRLGFFDAGLFGGPCWYSDRYLALLGYGREHRAQFEAGFRPLVHPDDVPALRSRLQRRERGGRIHNATEARLMRRDGRWIWVRWVGVVSERDAQGRPLRMVGTMESIDALKQREGALIEAHDELSALVDHAHHAIEEERKRLAGEVHDQLGQLLTLMRLELDQLAMQAGRQEVMLPVLDRMRSRVDETLQASRLIALRMRPAMLDLGLAAALRWLVEDFDARTGCACAFALDERAGTELPETVATALFRIAQEAMSNAARHAGPCRVQVRLERAGPALKLVIHDDGPGFDPVAVRRRARLGLIGMRERAQRIGARWTLHSTPGQGTRIEVLLPSH